MTPSLIAAGLNHLLAQQEQEQKRLAAHAGKLARIDVGLLDLRLRVLGDGSVAAAERDHAPDVSLFIRAADLPRILQDKERAVAYVRLEGDAEFANALSRLFSELKWDAEEDLARAFGDLVGRRLAMTARSGVDAARRVGQSVSENLTEYLLDEERLLVRRSSMDGFSDEVARLRDDVERMTKRLDRLAGRA